LIYKNTCLIFYKMFDSEKN